MRRQGRRRCAEPIVLGLESLSYSLGDRDKKKAALDALYNAVKNDTTFSPQQFASAAASSAACVLTSMRYAARTSRQTGRAERGLDRLARASGLYFVADGMGGHASGDVASRIEGDAARQRAEPAAASRGGSERTKRVRRPLPTTPRTRTWVRPSSPFASRIVTPRSPGSATAVPTCAQRNAAPAPAIIPTWKCCASRNLSETQLRGHPNKNLVTQTLGIGTPEPSSLTEPLRKGDWLLLCSDGLNDELEDAEIAKILRAHSAPDAAADALIAAALAHGGRDNVSAVLVEYDGPNGVSFDQKTILWLAVVGGACAAILLAILWWWFYGR